MQFKISFGMFGRRVPREFILARRENMLDLRKPRGRCGEMADATDLKSVRVKTLCGFESRHRHCFPLLDYLGAV